MEETTGAYLYDKEPPLPAETSVETALNSRCSSDRDRKQNAGHWGIYDPDTPIPLENLHALTRGVQVPRFTNYALNVDFERRPIVLAMSGDPDGIERRWLSIESGMQHQAVHLVCAALGMGTCIYNLGVDGRDVGERLWGTASMGLEMMRPSYGRSFWSMKAPDDWVSDPLLSEPRRSGDIPLLQAVEDLATSADGKGAEWSEVSQLLWAARGRTPHLYMGRRWGLTIPTWAGGQDIARLYLVSADGVFRYLNWRGDNPTHALERVSAAPDGFDTGRYTIVAAANEQRARALWECGYMLFSLFVQAIALDVRYDASLTGGQGVAEYERLGIADAAVEFSVYRA